MIDPFVLLAPVLLLGVIALLKFVGCDIVFGLTEIPPLSVKSINPTSGPADGGTTVVIIGTTFIEPVVTMGGDLATIVGTTTSEAITATTPPHAPGVVDVVVAYGDGSASSTLPNAYTYTSPGPITFVQVNSGPPTVQASLASVAVAYPGVQTAGNLNIVVAGWGDTTAAVASVMDSLGNSYTLAVGPTSGTGLRQAIYYAKNIAAGANTVTVTFNQAAAFPDVRILEYSGVDTQDLPATAAAAGTGTAADSGSATTTMPNELIFGAGTSGNTFMAAGTGFTRRPTNPLFGNLVEDQVVSSAGSQSATAINNNANWVMQMACFFKAP